MRPTPPVDQPLEDLIAALMAEPYPAECRGMAIHGVELVLLDADIYGVASWYRDNQDALTVEHDAMLHQLVDDVEKAWTDLPTNDTRVFYGKARDLGNHLLTTRGTPRSGLG